MTDTIKESITIESITRRWSPTYGQAVVAVLLAMTILLGAYFRLVGNNWDDFVHFHPDERYLTGVGIALGGNLSTCDPSDESPACIERNARVFSCRERYPETFGRGGYFDADCSPYNPENVTTSQYSYGTLPLFMARSTAELVSEITNDTTWLGYNGLHRVWRALNAYVDTVIILVVFFIGLRLYDKWVGLVAAMLYAGAVLPIQLSHFGTADVITNLFVTLALYFAVRAQDSGSMWDYAGFGLALGAAVASRVNVVPLAGVIVVVAVVRSMPAFDGNLAWRARNRISYRNFVGLSLAAVMSLIVFRLANPYAFSGPSLLGILPYERFLDALAQSRQMASGAIDWAPNWQWVNRTPYLFSFQNIVLWGAGLALGVTAWVAWGWAGWSILRGKIGGLRNVVPVAWILGYFAIVGGLWVMSMRYYLPLYPSFALLAAWLIVVLVKRFYQSSFPIWKRALAPVPLIVVLGFTLLWGAMFTNIYRHMATFTQASHWVWENLPGDFYMHLDDSSSDTPLINIPLWNTRVPGGTPLEQTLLEQASRLRPGVTERVPFVVPADGTISTVYAPHLGDPLDANDERVLRVDITHESDSTPLATAELTSTFPRNEHFLGDSYTLEFDQPFEVKVGETYFFNVELQSGSPIVSAGTVILNEPWDEGMPAKVCTLPAGITLADDPPPGLLSSQDCNGRSALEGLFNSLTLDLHWEDDSNKRDRMQIMLDQADTIIIGTNRRYDSQSRNPDRWPMTNRYYDALFSGELGFDLVATFQEAFEFGPLRISDQHLPTYDSPGWLNEFEPEEAFHVYDHPVVFIFQKNADYSSRNTQAILNSVELNRVGIGGGYNDPTIVNVITGSSQEVDSAPSHLQFSHEVRDIQEEGGTWSERFDTGRFLNGSQFVTMLVWWLMIMLFGLVTWPLLFLAFPALADRGYGFSKMVGMMLIGWGTWLLATLRVPVWSQLGIAGGFLVLTGVSGYVAWRRRSELMLYFRTRWRLLVIMEAITLVLFLVLIGIRLTNPDLWHQSFGGEKPMDFAYFNGVLRSTVFPPIDPWFSGGYLNYYYFGYVIVAVPTLLLGVVPSLAYNLILPTLFAVTGIGAFSIAFSIVNGWREREVIATPSEEQDHTAVAPSIRRKPIGNPWIAGIMALLLAVVFGNLDTARVFTKGVARLGGYEEPSGLGAFLIDEYVEDYGLEPDDSTLLVLLERAEDNRIGDRLRYQWNTVTSMVEGFVDGTREMFRGELYISPDRWFWGPTRVITEIPPPDDGAINEMPFFTFLYADMHAHMISMPLMLFAVAFLFNEMMVAGRDRRTWWAQACAFLLGAVTVGLFQATNTWDYPTFVILSVAGLGYFWWLTWRRVSRWSLLAGVGRIGGFVLVGQMAALPFTWWFKSGLTQFKIWGGQKTPLWAYLDIHGLFVFLLFSLLVWETARWLRSERVAVLRGRRNLLTGFLIGGVVILAITMVLQVLGFQWATDGESGSLLWLSNNGAGVGLMGGGYPAALIVLPFIAWIALLFFRKGQSRPMQYVLVLAGLGLAITLGTEFITLANDNGRQNTVFKFYIQVWLLLSVVGGAAFAWIISNSLAWRTRLAAVWYAVAGVLIFVAAMYPIMATRGKAEFRFTTDVPLTLDGMDYMQYASHWEGEPFDLIHDYNVIRWLQENVDGSPVIIEAISTNVLYQWGARITNYTGLPSVIGWDHHQRQQRSLDPLPQLVSQRVANVNAFYTTRDISAAMDILRHYDIEYVIVSQYEKVRYGETGGLDKFDWMSEQSILDVAYQRDEATIYQVNKDILYAIWAAALPETYE